MATNLTYRGQRGRRRAFTVVECLIGLAISALLLAAVAVAFNASLTSYRENERMFWSMNNARQALSRMTSQLRTGYTVNPAAPSHQCSFWTATDQDITYEFRSADKKLYLRTNSTGQEYVLCDNVVAASFSKTPTDDGMDCKSVQISLTVEEGDSQLTLSAAAVIRRNLGT
jgi:prepilin-type N-terminal cleavage/methylation domain-containing protein